MSFFKDFKEDFTQAMNELMPDGNEMYDDDELIDESLETEYPDKAKKKKEKSVNEKLVKDKSVKEKRTKLFKKDKKAHLDITPEENAVHILSKQEAAVDEYTTEQAEKVEDIDIAPEDMLKQIDDLLECELYSDDAEPQEESVDYSGEPDMGLVEKTHEEAIESEDVQAEILRSMEYDEALEDKESEEVVEEVLEKEALDKILEQNEEVVFDHMQIDLVEKTEENNMEQEKDVISINSVEEVEKKLKAEEQSFNVEDAETETTYITKGTQIKGDLETDGSIDIIGSVEGNVICKGKVVVGGSIVGDITAGELYANSARIEGDIKSYGSVKVGVGTIIIGEIKGESAVIAGAIHGDIDVNGPVIVDSTAVIMGNIKSRSVQINNGAVIEGFCSQAYSDIDVKSFFA